MLFYIFNKNVGTDKKQRGGERPGGSGKDHEPKREPDAQLFHFIIKLTFGHFTFVVFFCFLKAAMTIVKSAL